MTIFLRFMRRSWIYVLGFASLIWFLIRVIPKPSRATYPCQRAAFPLASAFVLWLSASLMGLGFLKKAGKAMQQKRMVPLALSLMAAVGLFMLAPVIFPGSALGSEEGAAVAPPMLRSYDLAEDQYIDPMATVSMVKSEKADVFSITMEEVESMVREAVALAGGMEALIDDGMTVVLKPNLVNYQFKGVNVPAEANGMVTDWRVTAAVAKMVRELNPTGRILVMEGTAGGPTSTAYEVLNYTKESMPEVDEFLALESTSGGWHDYDSDQLHAELLPAGMSLSEEFQLPNGSAAYYYNKTYFESDLIISLPVLKNHESAGMTGAVKNMGIGATPTNIYGNYEGFNGRWDIIIHQQASKLHNFIHDFYLGCPAQFAIMDGIQGYNNGPTDGYGSSRLSGHQEQMGLVLASADPIAMDAIAALVMFDDPSKVNCLVNLNNSGQGCSDPMAIRVTGARVSDVKKPFAHESHRTPCDYTDARAPNADVELLEVEGQLMKLSLSGTGSVTRIDVRVDGQAYGRYVVSGFDYFEIPLDGMELSDTLVELEVHDRYMNTQALSVQGNYSMPTGSFEEWSAEAFTAYPNPVLSDLYLKFFNGDGGQVLASLYSMSGQLEAERSLHLGGGMVTMTMDMGGLQAGQYLVVVQTGTKRLSMPVVKH